MRGTAETRLILGNIPRAQDEFPFDMVCRYFDSAFMDNSQHRHFTVGYAFYCAGSLMSWSSWKQRTIALSTIVVEYLVRTQTTKVVVCVPLVFWKVSTLLHRMETTKVLMYLHETLNIMARQSTYMGVRFTQEPGPVTVPAAAASPTTSPKQREQLGTIP